MDVTRLSLTTLASGALCVLLAGCGASDDETPKTGGNDCEYSRSKYSGDCLALSTPDPAKGFQLHFGPTNYDDQAEVEKFLLPAKGEKVLCLYMTTPNEQDVYFDEYHATARPGTHHMILFAGAGTEETPPDGTFQECQGGGRGLPYLAGAQNGIDPRGARVDVPAPNKPIPTENVGFGTSIAKKTRVAYQVHYVNNGTEPLLQESWANFVYKPAEQVTQNVSPLFWIGGVLMNVPAGSTQVVQARCENPANGKPQRLASLVGHMHAHTTRFSAYKVERSSQERKLVYEVFDWAHAETFFYDSVSQNTASDRVRRQAGASTGELILQPGDRLEWECEVQNTTSQPLKFANEAYTAEMCNVFGQSTPGSGNSAWDCYSL